MLCGHGGIRSYNRTDLPAEGLRRICASACTFKKVEQGITADGIHVRSIDRLRAGQKVVLKMPSDTLRVEGVEMPLSILYEDEDVLVADKPAGLAVHPSKGHNEPTLAAAVIAHYEKQGGQLSFRPLNRLDRNTSGLLLAAKNAHSANLLSNRTKKEYLAIVLGRLEGEGVIEQPIRIKPGFGITREVGEGGKYCLTRWHSLASNDRLSLLRVIIETGRTHQIRVHMSFIGHPLAGSDTEFLSRHALHCFRLGFIHPISRIPVDLTAPIPEDMASLLREQGWDEFRNLW